MSWSAFGGLKGDSVNGHAFPSEKLHHDKLDQLAEVWGGAPRVSVCVFACVRGTVLWEWFGSWFSCWGLPCLSGT